MYLSEELQKKWQPVVEHDSLPPITDKYRKAVTSILLENQETAMREQAVASGQVSLTEAGEPTNNIGTGNIGTFDPVLISLVRRAMPNLVAYDICGVQPMTGPTGLIFAMRARYGAQSGTSPMGDEALYNEANTAWSATLGNSAGQENLEDFGGYHANTHTGLEAATTAAGMTTLSAENAGSSSTNAIAEMAFTIDKVTVTAKSRALKAEYSVELAQDLKAVHGLDAETELANILSAEILAEINREVVRTVVKTAYAGANTGTATQGIFDLDVDANGRWSVEKFKGLMFQIEREANLIAKLTRRGRGNMIICSSDVASALSMAGALDHAPALKDNLNVDDTGNTFAGVLNGRFKVYIDPYFQSTWDHGSGTGYGEDIVTVGYKGSSAYDAGLFYCPYVPLQMVRAVGENNFQPKIGFKTRYGLVANPFATSDGDGQVGDGNLNDANGGAIGAADRNRYYSTIRVQNLL
tara:strand:+ start:8456 stop:9859 length:1404 start_codon:yes stop_codon:yes gene_type:complete